MSEKFVWSEYQKAIFRDVQKENHHTIIEARSGSSKTTTLIEALKYIPPNKSILLLAFNKKIAVELEDRAPEYKDLTIKTIHSFGYSVVKEAVGKKLKFDPDKSFKIIKALLAKDKRRSEDKDNYEAIYEMDRALNLCKNLLVDSPSKIDEVLDDFNIQTAGYFRQDFIYRIIWALAECKKLDTVIDFTDMIYFPFVFQLPIPQYDRICWDEVQDHTPLQQYLVLNACKPDGRILAAGDSYQMLYSWTGAKLNNLEQLKEKLNAVVLPLPISYRCAKRIVFEAQKIVPDITFAPNAFDGEVHTIQEDQVAKLIRPGDFFLSRTNAELVKWCFAFWRDKIPANIKGKELGIGMTAVIKQSKKRTVRAFLEWLELWKKEEVERLKAKHRDINPVIDRIECLKVLCEGRTEIEEVKQVISELFSGKSKESVVILGTVHSSKGLEAERVFVLMNTFRFGEGQEELNCKYVALTRAKRELYQIE